MTERHYKAVYFDLNTNKLKKVYPGRSYVNAYKDLKRFFEKWGFSHRQRSGYISENKLNEGDVFDMTEALRDRFPWLKHCVNRLDVTNIGAQFDLAELLWGSVDLHLCDVAKQMVLELYDLNLFRTQQTKRLCAYAESLSSMYRAS